MAKTRKLTTLFMSKPKKKLTTCSRCHEGRSDVHTYFLFDFVLEMPMLMLQRTAIQVVDDLSTLCLFFLPLN